MTVVNFNEIAKEILYAIENNLSISTYANANNYTKKGDKMFTTDWPSVSWTWKPHDGIIFSVDKPKNKESEKPKVYNDLIPVRVIFNEPATIVFWNDGTKTVVRCAKGEKFIPEVGVAEAITKKVFGGTRRGRERFLRLIKKATWQEKIDK